MTCKGKAEGDECVKHVDTMEGGWGGGESILSKGTTSAKTLTPQDS